MGDCVFLVVSFSCLFTLSTPLSPAPPSLSRPPLFLTIRWNGRQKVWHFMTRARHRFRFLIFPKGIKYKSKKKGGIQTHPLLSRPQSSTHLSYLFSWGSAACWMTWICLGWCGGWSTRSWCVVVFIGVLGLWWGCGWWWWVCVMGLCLFVWVYDVKMLAINFWNEFFDVIKKRMQLSLTYTHPHTCNHIIKKTHFKN